MPIPVGGVSPHDDGMHLGSAKRGVANGLASLDAAATVPAAQIPDISATYATAGHTHASLTVTSAGSYDGNNTQNRAIAHNLGRTPKYVIIQGSHASAAGAIYILVDTLLVLHGTVKAAVTGWDGTNFYVGSAAFMANDTNYTFKWLAVG